MRRAGQVVREVLELVRSTVKPGATTLDLENAAETRLTELGVKAAFKGYHGFPCVLCTSVNSEVVHGIPSAQRVLKSGDIVSVDFGAVVDGYFGDAAITVPVVSVSTVIRLKPMPGCSTRPWRVRMAAMPIDCNAAKMTVM